VSTPSGRCPLAQAFDKLSAVLDMMIKHEATSGSMGFDLLGEGLGHPRS